MKELEKSELKAVNGGLFWLIPFFAGAFGSELLFEGPSKCWKEFKEGFNSIKF